MKLLASLLAFAAVSPLPFVDGGAPAAPKLQVFLLVGQSNMEGKGFPEPAAWQLGQAEFRDRYAHLVEGGDVDAFLARLAASPDPNRPDYAWGARDDVWIEFLGKRGPLTVGYGVPSKCFGPELGFGHVVGDHLDAPVLLIKTAWGGKSLGRDFRPPSVPLPTDAEFEAMVAEKNEQARKHNESNPDRPKAMVTVEELKAPYGHFYRETIREAREALAALDERFPDLEHDGYELAGMVWFQGWNDQFDETWAQSYGDWLAAFVDDVRKDLEAPDLPVVIGQVGWDGKIDQPKEDGSLSNRGWIQRGQAALAARPGYEDSVRVVPTHVYWDQDAHAIYHGPGGWSADVDRWRQHGNDRPYHYLGSPWFFLQAGNGFGAAMVELLDAR